MKPDEYAQAVLEGKLKHAYPTLGNDVASFTRCIRRIDRIPVHYGYAQKCHTPKGETREHIYYFKLPTKTAHLTIGERVAKALEELYASQATRIGIGLHPLSVLESYDNAMAGIANGDWGAAVIGAAKMAATRLRFFSVIADTVVANAQQEARQYPYFSPAVRIRRPGISELQKVSIRCYP